MACCYATIEWLGDVNKKRDRTTVMPGEVLKKFRKKANTELVEVFRRRELQYLFKREK